MLKVRYKCKSCKTTYKIKWNDHNKETIKWLKEIGNNLDWEWQMIRSDGKWFIEHDCPVCKTPLMSLDKFKNWGYVPKNIEISFDYSKCNPKFEDWFSLLNG